MPEFDKILVRPSRVQLLDALLEATRAATHAANGSARFPFDEPFWLTFLNGISLQREGSNEWQETPPTPQDNLWDAAWTGLAVAWWTDHAGGRHYRILVGVGFDPGDSLLAQDQSPLKTIYPERLFHFRKDREESRWVAVCSCGEYGTPESLAWMGPRCGPCHDRLDEGEQAPASPFRSEIHLGTQLAHLAFSPDGRRLAAVTEDHSEQAATGSELRVVDLATQNRSLMQSPGEVQALAFSHDGNLLACGAKDRLVIHDLQIGQVIVDDRDPHEDFLIESMRFSPNGKYLALIGPAGMRLWELQDGLWQRTLVHAATFTALAFSPDGRQLVLGGDGMFLMLDLPWGGLLWSLRKELPAKCTLMSIVCMDRWGQHWMCAGRDGPQNRRECFTVNLKASGPEIRSCHGFEFGLFALSHRGRWLIHADGDSFAVRDLVNHGSVHWLDEWKYQWGLHSLTFTPDDQGIIVGHRQGVIEFWPYRALLGLDSHNPSSV